MMMNFEMENGASRCGVLAASQRFDNRKSWGIAAGKVEGFTAGFQFLAKFD